MNTISKETGMKDRKVVLSTLWIFATLNYIYADVFGLFFTPTAQKETLAMPQAAGLVFAVMMETSIAMVLASRYLKYGVNRWVNVIFALFHTALVAWSLTGAAQPPFYIFFASLEMICTLFIVWYAWKWPNPEGQTVSRPAQAS
jgi:hypothetical protein